MLSRTVASNVACNFLAYYYNEFVKVGDMMSSMSDLYDDNSYVVLADLSSDTPSIVQGKAHIAVHLAKLDNILSQRKVEVITADSMPLPNGSVQIVCQGVMYLTKYRRVFLHVICLEPTTHRPNTFHIATDYLRFVNVEEEVIPEGAVVMTKEQVAIFIARREEEQQRQRLLELQQRIKDQQQKSEEKAAIEIPTPASRQMQQQQQQQHQTREAPRDQQQQQQARGPRQPRPDRPERPPRPDRDNNGAAQPPRQQQQQREERPPRGERKPRENRPVTAAEKTGEFDKSASNNNNNNINRRENNERRERERKPRDQQQRGENKGEADNKAAPRTEGRQQRDGRPAPNDRERKPRNNRNGAEKTDEAAADSKQQQQQGPKAVRDGPTAFVRFAYVPKDVKLSDITAAVAKDAAETPLDAFWFGRGSVHAIVKFASEGSAAKFLAPKKYMIAEHEVSIFSFYP